jgi:hypothetical protein
LKDQTENAVIRSYKIIALSNYDNRPSPASHTRINYRKVYCSFRELIISCFEGECGFPYVLGSDLVGYIDELNLLIDLKYDPFHTCSKRVFCAEIGCQRNDRRHLSPGILSVKLEE